MNIFKILYLKRNFNKKFGRSTDDVSTYSLLTTVIQIMSNDNNMDDNNTGCTVSKPLFWVDYIELDMQ